MTGPIRGHSRAGALFDTTTSEGLLRGRVNRRGSAGGVDTRGVGAPILNRDVQRLHGGIFVDFRAGILVREVAAALVAARNRALIDSIAFAV